MEVAAGGTSCGLSVLVTGYYWVPVPLCVSEPVSEP